MMKRGDILKEYPLVRAVSFKESKVLEKILKEVNESFVLIWRKEKMYKIEGRQIYYYYIQCPQTNFADAYAHFGLLWQRDIIPYKKRNK